MEIHHHSQTARKKWTHYFWEFLMLFLAVFCGFLAEYQLEHVIELKREKKYIQSLAEDLRYDSLEFEEDMETWQSRLNIIDTLREELSIPITTQSVEVLYNMARKFWGITTFIYTDRTIEQLRHSGEFRLLNKDVVAKLLEYDGKIRTSVRDREAILLRTYQELIDIQNSLFDSRVFDQLRRNSREGNDSAASAKPVVYVPLVNNPEKRFLYLNKLYQYQYNISTVIGNEFQAKDKLTRLQVEIKKHYTIKQ